MMSFGDIALFNPYAWKKGRAGKSWEEPPKKISSMFVQLIGLKLKKLKTNKLA